MDKEKIRNLDEVIKEIENCAYIDCHEDEIFDDYQYENILYYLKQLKKKDEVIKKAKEYIENNVYYSVNSGKVSLTLENDSYYDLLQILEDKEVK